MANSEAKPLRNTKYDSYPYQSIADLVLVSTQVYLFLNHVMSLSYSFMLVYWCDLNDSFGRVLNT
jgi:hypothetical protein